MGGRSTNGNRNSGSTLLMGPEDGYRRLATNNRIALTDSAGATIYISTMQPDGTQLNEVQIRQRAFEKKIPKNQVSINDSQYQFSTGTMPRGNGTWFFFRKSSQDIDGEYITVSGKYSEAKKKAISIAAYYGWKSLYVGS